MQWDIRGVPHRLLHGPHAFPAADENCHLGIRIQAELCAELRLAGHRAAEGRADRKAQHADLLLLEPAPDRLLLDVFNGDKAAVHFAMEPQVMAAL